jgi:hypothetical protein
MSMNRAAWNPCGELEVDGMVEHQHQPVDQTQKNSKKASFHHV